jgi:hypothetical protein
LRALAYLCGTAGVVFFSVALFLKIQILPTLVIVLLCVVGTICFVIASYMEMAALKDKEAREKRNDGEG